MAAIAGAVLVCSLPVHAQLDPLLFLKRIPPNVLLVVDTRADMLNDADGTYYDPNRYSTINGNGAKTAAEVAIGVTSTTANQYYRRKFVGFSYTSGGTGTNSYVYTANSISTLGDLQSGWGTTTILFSSPSGAGLSQDSFYTKTRYNVARTALTQVIAENSNYARFGLLKMRQSSPVWGTLSTSGQTQSPRLNDLSTSPDQRTNTDTTKTGLWYVVRNTVLANNGSITTVQTPLVKPDSSSANSNVSTILSLGVGSALVYLQILPSAPRCTAWRCRRRAPPRRTG